MNFNIYTYKFLIIFYNKKKKKGDWPNDVDSADNETDSVDLQFAYSRRKSYEKTELNNSRNNYNVQASLSYGVLRSNQLVRARTRPETRL